MFNYKIYELLTEEEKKEFLESEENISKIFSMVPISLNNFGRSIDVEKANILLRYKHLIISMKQLSFLPFFNAMNSDSQIELLKDKDVFNYFMNLEINKNGKHPFNFLSPRVRLYVMCNHKEILKNYSYLRYINDLEKEDQVAYFESLNNYIKNTDEKTLKLSKNDVLLNMYRMHHSNDLEEQKYWFLRKFRLNEKSLCGQFSNLITHKQVNLAYAFKLKTEREWILFLKFGVYFPELKKEEDSLGISLSKEMLEMISAKEIKHIYKEIMDRNNKPADDLKSFVLALKLYSVFGLDNSLKIVKGSFSKLNEKTLETSGKLHFIDLRREYRMEHQDEFYNYEVLENVKKCIETDDYEYLSRLLHLNQRQTSQLVNELIKEWRKVKDSDKLELFLTDFLKKAIRDRENRLQETYISTFKKDYIESDGTIKQNNINLFDLFKDVKLTKDKFLPNGKANPNPKLVEFLLGNEKYDNDCVLRMTFNNMAFGLNRTLSNVINKFDVIENMISKSEGKMKITSLLDVIDASKVMVYQLKPNEIDISLDTIAKIQNSRQHCNENASIIVRKTKELHTQRKRKFSSSIPLVKDTLKNGLSYEVLAYDDEKLLTAGIDTGSCFKVGGPGEDFLRYCLTDKNGAVLSIKTKTGYYICPIIRNGNAIFGNSIDPEPETFEETKNVIETIRAAYDKICSKSDIKEPIEMGMITDVHSRRYFAKRQYEKFELDRGIIIGNSDCYTDYHKPSSTHYILYKENEDVEIKYYNPQITYLSPRQEPFFYLSSMERNKESIEGIINSIGYTLHQMDSANSSKKYQPYKIDDFSAVIGNKDWFIGFRKTTSIESRYIPYDPRAQREMLYALAHSPEMVSKTENMEGKGYGKY